MCSTGYVNCEKIHFRIIYLTLLNCRFKNRLSYIGLVYNRVGLLMGPSYLGQFVFLLFGHIYHMTKIFVFLL